MSKKSVTICDIARLIDMSEATVSLALNGSPLVKDETRERVNQAAKELGYVPNLYAKRLVSGKSGVIGLVVPDIENIYYSSFVKCLSDRMAQSDYSLSIFISSGSPDKEVRAIRDMIASRVEGIVYVPCNRPADLSESRKLLSAAAIPTVCATTYVEGMNCVYCDLEGGMADITSLILGGAPQRIVCMTGRAGVWTIDCRTEAFLKTSAGKADAEIVELPEIDHVSAFEAAGRLLDDLPDAVVCVNDYVALGVVNRFISAGVSIPGRVSVTGFDDSIFSVTSPIPLTTVRQDVGELAGRTVSAILKMIGSEEKTPESICLPTTIVKRKTTK